MRPSNDNHTGQRRPWEIATDAIGGLVLVALLGLVAWAFIGGGGNSP
jgi:hypothetical protein